MGVYKSISLSFLSQIINLVISFVLSILISRLLGKAGRGEYVLIITSMGFIVQVLCMGMESSITYYLSNKLQTLQSLFYSINKIILAAIGTIIAIIGIQYFCNSHIFLAAPSGNNKLVYSVCLGILCIINLLNTITASMLNGLKLYNTVIVNSILLQLIIFIAVIILWAFTFTNYTNTGTILFITIAAYSIIFIVNSKALLAVASTNNNCIKMSKVELKAFFKYSFISFLCGVFQYLSYKSDFWVVHYYKGASALGVYSLAATLSQLLWIIPQSIATILFPYSGNLVKEALAIIICRLGRVSLFIIIIIVMAAAALAKYFIPLIYGTEYTEAVHLFIYFLIGIVPFTLVKIISSAFAGIGKIKYNLIISVLSFAIGLIAYLILIPKYGLIGGVIGSNISYFLSTIIALYFFKKNYTIKYSDILFIKMNDFKAIFLKLKSI